MIVTIDGPAGAGKSTVARLLAERLGFEFLDTGAMYRAVTLAALEADVDLTDREALRQLADEMSLELNDHQVVLNGVDVSQKIRTREVTSQIHFVADPPEVRQVLVRRQQAWVADRNVVTEGRDQGTVAFPQAECKIFLTASPQERARRRCDQLRGSGVEVQPDQVLEEQLERDRRDASRPEGALRAARDAIEVLTDGLSTEQVVEKLALLVMTRVSAQQ